MRKLILILLFSFFLTIIGVTRVPEICLLDANNNNCEANDLILRNEKESNNETIDKLYSLSLKEIEENRVTADSTKFLIERALASDPRAYYWVSMIYEKGLNVPKNHDLAAGWLIKASNKNDIRAIHKLAQWYEIGYSVNKNQEKALQNYLQLAKLNYREAQYKVGEYYEQGFGTSQNLSKAIIYYTLAAEQNHTQSYYQLSHIYEISNDCQKAIQWYTKISSQYQRNCSIQLKLLKLTENCPDKSYWEKENCYQNILNFCWDSRITTSLSKLEHFESINTVGIFFLKRSLLSLHDYQNDFPVFIAFIINLFWFIKLKLGVYYYYNFYCWFIISMLYKYCFQPLKFVILWPLSIYYNILIQLGLYLGLFSYQKYNKSIELDFFNPQSIYYNILIQFGLYFDLFRYQEFNSYIELDFSNPQFKENTIENFIKCVNYFCSHQVISYLLNRLTDILGMVLLIVIIKGWLHLLVYLSQNGKFRLIKFLIEIRFFPLSFESFTKSNALIAASENGHFDVVVYLIKNKIKPFPNPNMSDLNGTNALMKACLEGHIQIVIFFCKYNIINLHMVDNEEMNVLMYAAKGGHLYIIKYLLEHSDFPCINSKSKTNETVLSLAAWNGNIHLVKYLLENKIAPFTNIHTQNTNALVVASKAGHMEIVKYLIENQVCSFTDINNSGKDAISAALLNNHFEIFNYLISQSFAYFTDIHATFKTGDNDLSATQFHNKIFNKYIISQALVVLSNIHEIIEDMILFLFPSNQTYEMKLLSIACCKENIEAIDILMKREICPFKDIHAKVNSLAKDSYSEGTFHGYNALMIACKRGDLEIVQYLIENQYCFYTDISADKAPGGYNVAMIAVRSMNLNVLKYLIESKYTQFRDIHARNDSGFTIFMLYNYLNIYNGIFMWIYLFKLRFLLNEPFIIVFKKFCYDQLCLLHYILVLVTIYFLFEWKITIFIGLFLFIILILYLPWMIISWVLSLSDKKPENRILEFIKSFDSLDEIKKFSDSFQQMYLAIENIDGNNILLNASKINNLSIIEYLLELHPSRAYQSLLTSINSKIHYNVLMYACEAHNMKMIEYFFENACISDIYAKDIWGNDVMMIACKLGHMDLVKYFVENPFFPYVLNFNIKNLYGYNCLMYACEKNDLLLVGYLLYNHKGDPVQINDLFLDQYHPRMKKFLLQRLY